MKKPATKRQKQLLGAIYEHIKHTGYPPTFSEMREKMGVSSNQSVIDHLNKLLEARLLQKSESAARGLSILPAGYRELGRPPLVGFLGMTSAGSPIETIEISGQWQEIPSVYDKLSRLDHNVFILRVLGDSMINAGINDGDAVLVQEKKEFSSGEIVLAQIGGESTIKRFISEDKPPYVYLKPENPNYENILFTDETQLTGKVISVLKNNYWKPVK